MLKYIILAILGTTVSAQCCDRRASECQSQYSACMSSTTADFQQRCESVFCTSAPYPLPTTCCDQKQPECQTKYQQCLAGTFGSFSLCASTFCSTSNEPSRIPSPDFTKVPEPTRVVEKPSPEPTRIPEQPTPAPTRVVEKPSPEPTRIPEQPTPAPTRIPQLPSPDFTKMPIPSIPNFPPTDFTCCDRESEMCQKLHATCVSSGGVMCDMMYCERTPLPSRSAFPSRKPKPSPRFSAFPSPKFLREVPSILPKEIKSTIQLIAKERKEIENVTKIREIQVKISCSLRMPLDNIKIRNVTFIDSNGIRNIIKFNEADIDAADIPSVDCFSSTTNARMLQSSNVEIDYTVINPTAELLAYDPVNLVTSVSSPQQSSAVQTSPSTNLTTILASVFGGALAVIGVSAMVMYIRARNKPKPIKTQERAIRVSVNPLEAVVSLPRNDSSRRQFSPQGSRV